jgi:hypothetical protein
MIALSLAAWAGIQAKYVVAVVGLIPPRIQQDFYQVYFRTLAKSTPFLHPCHPFFANVSELSPGS